MELEFFLFFIQICIYLGWYCGAGMGWWGLGPRTGYIGSSMLFAPFTPRIWRLRRPDGRPLSLYMERTFQLKLSIYVPGLGVIQTIQILLIVRNRTKILEQIFFCPSFGQCFFDFFSGGIVRPLSSGSFVQLLDHRLVPPKMLYADEHKSCHDELDYTSLQNLRLECYCKRLYFQWGVCF